MSITEPRPYFAEVPYYLWGTVNYDSEGDCSRPTARDWTWLHLLHRDTGESVEIESNGDAWSVVADESLAVKVSRLLQCRSDAILHFDELNTAVADHSLRLERADHVAREFANPVLTPFDSHLFWGSWKWIGWFATEFTWVGRWIMLAVLKGDSRGINLCVEWLKDGTFSEDQSKALRYALEQLTGVKKDSDRAWVKWYYGGVLQAGAIRQFPEPDFDAWLIELKEEYGEAA